MHEYTVTKNILDIALEAAKEAKAKAITAISLVAGGFSSIMEEPVRMYFGIVSKDTIAEGAKLCFRRLPVIFVCSLCGSLYEKPESGFDCPQCHIPGFLHETCDNSVNNNEIYIESIEVE